VTKNQRIALLTRKVHHLLDARDLAELRLRTALELLTPEQRLQYRPRLARRAKRA